MRKSVTKEEKITTNRATNFPQYSRISFGTHRILLIESKQNDGNGAIHNAIHLNNFIFFCF